MGIDAELYFGTPNIEEALEKECERASKEEDRRNAYELAKYTKEVKKQWKPKEQSKIKKATFDNSYRVEPRYRFEKRIDDKVYDSPEKAMDAAKKILKEYFVLVNAKTNKPIGLLFDSEYDAYNYWEEKL